MLKIYKTARKHACFHVFSPFSAHLYPHYIIMDKGLIWMVFGWSLEAIYHKQETMLRHCLCAAGLIPLPSAIIPTYHHAFCSIISAYEHLIIHVGQKTDYPVTFDIARLR